MAKKVELLSPKRDVVFQVLFGEPGSEEITKSFLEAILGRKIENVDLSKNPILRRLKPDDKMGILDVLVKFNQNEYCNIEIQIRNEHDVKERALFYWSKTYNRGAKKGQPYSSLPKTIVVLILDFALEGLQDLSFFTSWKVIEEKERKKILTDSLEIVIIELPKIYKKKDRSKKELIEWLYFLENPKSERVKMIMEKNKGIKKAERKLEEISQDEVMQKLSDWRESAEILEAKREQEIQQIIEGRKELEKGRNELEKDKNELEKGKNELEKDKNELEKDKNELAKSKSELKESQQKLEKDQKNLHNEQKELQQRKKEMDQKFEIEMNKLKEARIKLAKSLLAKKIEIEEIQNMTGLTKEEIES